MEQNISIVGSEGTGKHVIGKKVVDMGKSMNMKCHTCTNLPVPENSDIYKTGVQFIAFMVHLTNKESMNCMLESLSKVDVAYYLGRSAIVANTKGSDQDEEDPQTQLKQLSTQYGVPVLFCNTELDDDITDTCRKLMRMINTCTGHRANISPLLLESVGASLSTEGRSQTQQGPSASFT